MPPWNSMSPQQQQMLLQMMMGRGTSGMQFGGTPGANPYSMVPNQTSPALAGLQTTPGFNPLANQAQTGMNPMMMQYLMGLQNQGGMPGAGTPSLAQLLQMRGTGMGL